MTEAELEVDDRCWVAGILYPTPRFDQGPERFHDHSLSLTHHKTYSTLVDQGSERVWTRGLKSLMARCNRWLWAGGRNMSGG